MTLYLLNYRFNDDGTVDIQTRNPKHPTGWRSKTIDRAVQTPKFQSIVEQALCLGWIPWCSIRTRSKLLNAKTPANHNRDKSEEAGVPAYDETHYYTSPERFITERVKKEN